MSLVGLDLLAGGRVPEPDRAVLAAREDVFGSDLASARTEDVRVSDTIEVVSVDAGSGSGRTLYFTMWTGP